MYEVPYLPSGLYYLDKESSPRINTKTLALVIGTPWGMEWFLEANSLLVKGWGGKSRYGKGLAGPVLWPQELPARGLQPCYG